MKWSNLANKASNGSKAVVRAAQTWNFLIGKAYNRQTIRYNELRDLLGYSDNRPLTPILGYLMNYCTAYKLPPITILVVNAEGKPGTGFTASLAFHKDLEKVFAYPWFNRIAPTVDELKATK